MSPRWIWSDKITNERVARVGYNHFISNKGEWNNCFSKFSNRVLPPSFISTILHFAHYFPYDVKLRILAHSRSFLANQKARNAIFGAENLLIMVNGRIPQGSHEVAKRMRIISAFSARYQFSHVFCLHREFCLYFDYSTLYQLFNLVFHYGN